jgi:hypothetical protein
MKGLPDEQIDFVCHFPWFRTGVDVKEKLLESVEDLTFGQMVVGLVDEFCDVGTVGGDETGIRTDDGRRRLAQEGGECKVGK